MNDVLTIQLQPEVSDFIRRRAHAEHLSVAEFVETVLLREKQRLEETERHLTVVAPPELLRQGQHVLVREADETDEEYNARSGLFAELLSHAGQD